MKRLIILINILCLTGIASTLFAQEVKINSNLAVEADGTLRLDGVATVWDDLMVYPDATSRGSNNPPTFTLFKSNASQGVWIWGFSNKTPAGNSEGWMDCANCCHNTVSFNKAKQRSIKSSQ